MRAAIPRLTAPPYPSTEEARAYAEDYRVNYFAKTGDLKGFHIYNHDRYIDITACGGKDNYFVIYAYPPGGFWFAHLEELEPIEPWRGWILHYHPPTQTWTVKYCTYHNAYEGFREMKRQLGL